MFTKLLSIVRDNKAILLIVALAVTLRFSYLTYTPVSLNWDEVSHGFNAYSILKTGKDEWGVKFPTIFRAYGDYKLPVYIYLTSLSELVFGINSFAVRLPSVLGGITIVLFTYLLTKKLFNREVAVISSFLVAVEPWSLFLSRGAFDANLSLAFIVSGVYYFLIGLERNKFLPLSFLLFGLSVWTYNSARVFTPLLIIILLIIYQKEVVAIFRKNKKVIAYFLAVIALFFIPMFSQLMNPIGQARYGKVAIIDEGAINKINELRSKPKFTPLVSRLIYNKATYFVWQFSKNWFSHFSFDFLFLKGGTQYQFSVPNKGLIYFVDIPFFLLGLLYLLTKRNRGSILVLCWLLISPVASSLTREAPHVLRSIVTLPMPMLISSLGFWSIYSWLKVKHRFIGLALIFSAGILLFTEAENYLTDYFNSYRNNYSWSWQYGYSQIVEYAKTHYSEYDKIIVTKKYGEPHEFFLFYWPWSPEKYLSDQDAIRFNQSNWWWVDHFDKFYFINDWNIPKARKINDWDQFMLEFKLNGIPWVTDCGYIKDIPRNTDNINVRMGGSCLLITSPGNVPDTRWRKLETIKFLDGKPAFEIYEIKPISFEDYLKHYVH